MAPRFSGEDIVNAAPLKHFRPADGKPVPVGNVWEVRFAKPMRGDIAFKIEYFERLSRKTEIVALNALDASDQRGRVALEENAVFSVAPECSSALETDFVGKTLILNMSDKTLGDWRKLASDVREGSFSAPSIRRFTEVSRNGFVTAETLELNVAQTDLLRIDAAGLEMLELRTDGRPAELFDAGDDEYYLLLRKKATVGSTRVEFVYRGNFAEGNAPKVEALRTSAHPARAEWYFSENLSGGTCAVSRIFGLPADKVAIGKNSSVVPKCFGDFIPCCAFETERYPYVDADASLVFFRDTPPPVGPERLDDKWAFSALALVVLLRVLVALLLRRRKINA